MSLLSTFPFNEEQSLLIIAKIQLKMWISSPERGWVDLVSTFFVIIEGWAEGLVSTGCQDLMVAWWSNILTPKFHHDSSPVKIRKPGFYLLSQKMGGGCAVGVGGIKSSGFHGYNCGYFVVLMILQCNYLLVITFSQCF